jgi:hypothetical protein
MFQKAALAKLQAEKDMLVLRSSMNRLKLVVDGRKLRSPDFWVKEAGRVVQRHPMMTAALAAAGGILGVQAVRSRGPALGGLARLGKLASMAFNVWKMVRPSKAETEE